MKFRQWFEVAQIVNLSGESFDFDDNEGDRESLISQAWELAKQSTVRILSDKELNSAAVIKATIIVNPVNDDPIAQADIYDTFQDQVLTLDAPGVLDNDYDPDGDTLTVTMLATPDHGILFLGDNGSFSYIPASGYVGQDFFIYRADDGNGGVADAAVTINVIEQPALLMSFGAPANGSANAAAGQVFSGLNQQNLRALDSWFSQLGKKKATAGGSGIASDLDADDIDNLLLWFDAA